MRCVIGIVLFLVLYFGSYSVSGEIVRARALANDPAHSQRLAKKARYDFLKKWHAALAVGAGVTAITVCALPTVLAGVAQRSEAERMARMERGEW